jgi:hypothetical protein
MTITSQYWPWYVAEYVISEARDGLLLGHSLHTYLIYADGAELAYAEALAIQSSLGDVVRDSSGAILEYHCLGMHNLDALQDSTMHSGQHLSVIPWIPTAIPKIREKHELKLFT